MAHISEDKVLETGVGVATTSFTLAGAVTGFRTFTSQLATNDTCFYSAFEVDTNGNPTGAFENGLGTLTAGTTLTRTTIIESSNAGAAVTFSGTLWIGLTLLATKTAQFDNNHAMKVATATTEPPNPSAGVTMFYAEQVMTGLTKLYQKSEFGNENMVQDSFAFNRVQKYQASGSGIATVAVNALTAAVGTAASVGITTGSAKNAINRVRYQSAATAGALASIYANSSTIASMWRGGANGEGGFLYVFQFSLENLVAGNRGFFGLVDVTTAPTNIDPTTSTTPGKIGLVFNANTGNWKLAHNVTGTAPTLIDLGATFPINTTDLMELILYAPPFTGGAAQTIRYKVNQYTTSVITPAFTATGTLSTNIPASTTTLNISNWMTNNATAALVGWNFNKAFVGSDT